MIVLCAAFAWLVAQFADLHWATLLLRTSPGGIAEMAITATVLQLGVLVVTAFHVTRLAAVLLLAEPPSMSSVAVCSASTKPSRVGLGPFFMPSDLAWMISARKKVAACCCTKRYSVVCSGR